MPLPHRNTIKFFGMGNKNDYLVWRQQDGTFSALDKKNLFVTMWSTVTGKIIKTESIDQSKEELEELPIDHVIRKEANNELNL